MKDNTHPDYYETEVTCGGCNNSFMLKSTSEKLNVNVCYNCHPFYTGTQKHLDTAGRVDKFKQKYAKFMDKKDA